MVDETASATPNTVVPATPEDVDADTAANEAKVAPETVSADAVAAPADTPTDGGDIPPVDSTTIAYLATFSKAGSYAHYAVVNAHNIDEAWTIAQAVVAGTAWTVTRVIVQPVYTGAFAPVVNDAYTDES